MEQRYEYEFVRLGEGFLGVRGEAKERYQDEVHARAKDGWRLVQVFAPGIGGYGTSKFYELIFERPIATRATSS